MSIRLEFSLLINELKTLAGLAGVEALLSWDQETYMPEAGIDGRAEQLSIIAKHLHHVHSSDYFRGVLAEWLDLNTGQIFRKDLNAVEGAFLRTVYRDWKFATAVPAEFVKEFARAKAQSQHAWQSARKNNDFSAFSPHLQLMVDFNAKQAQFFNPSGDAYDTLLDTYEPGLTSAQLDPVFAVLRSEIKTILAARKSITPFPIHEKFWDHQKQLTFSRMVLKDMGFDFTKGRLDQSAHPFSTQIHPSDVRITTRISDHDLLEGLGSTIHECGHALYEQGLPIQYEGTPLCQAISFGVHESQSRFWENGIGKHRAFWTYYFPKLCALFPENIGEGDFETFMAAVLEVKPGLIRVQADELTYNLHIMIRYELERDLFSGRLTVGELPGAWREKYKDYLGVVVPTDAEGVLQDVHWSCGYFGYFPTYSVGNLMAAMLMTRIGEDLDIATMLQGGNLRGIRDWLKTHVHQVGRLKSADEWMTALCGDPLRSSDFVSQMTERYCR